MKRKILVLLTTLTLLISFVGLLAGCEKAVPPYYVKLDVYEPNCQLIEAKNYATYLTLTYDGEPKVFDIKVYSIGQKRYINDNDIEIGTLNSKISVAIKKENDSHHFPIDFEKKDEWPTEVGYYNISINFNDSVIGYNNLDPNYRIAFLNIYLTIKEE